MSHVLHGAATTLTHGCAGCMRSRISRRPTATQHYCGTSRAMT